MNTMQPRLIAGLLITSLWFSPTPVTYGQQTEAHTSPTTTVPAGTVIPLTLVTPIKSKSTKPGDTIRAVVAFPVTIGDQLAVPADTYVEGILNPPLKKAKHTPKPDVQIHFLRLLFASGYTVTLDATQSRTLPPDIPFTDNTHASYRTASFVTTSGFASRQTVGPTPQPPPLPPLPSHGPSPALIDGAFAGGTAGILILLGVFHHRHAKDTDTIVHDAGWQFQMTLQNPLILDKDKITLQQSHIQRHSGDGIML